MARAWFATGASRETVCKTGLKGPFFASAEAIAVDPQGVVMSHHRVRWRLFCSTLCLAVVLIVDAPVAVAVAAKIKMVFPGPVTTFSLPYLVAQKKGWMSDLEVEDVHVTGDSNTMRVLLSGNADIGLIGTLNVLESIHAAAVISAVHTWQPTGDY